MANIAQDWEITVTGAYNRDYQTADEAFTAWLANKDFYIWTPGYPSYINRQDAEHYGIPNNTIRIRYKKKTEVFFAKFNPETKQWTRSLSTDEDEIDTEESLSE